MKRLLEKTAAGHFRLSVLGILSLLARIVN
jgi:hypothetical protein